MRYKDYWIGLEGDLVHDLNLQPPAKYRWVVTILWSGFERMNRADAYAVLEDMTDTDYFKVMVF
jgi:hypothetical protein